VISTLTPNPSLDLTYKLFAPLARDTFQRAAAVSVEAGGKGINVSRNLVAIAVGTVVSAALVIGIKQFTGGADTEKATSQAS